MNVIEQLLEERLVIISRGIPNEKLLKCCEALLKADICFLETTFNHLLPNPIVDNESKIKAMRRVFGNRIHIGVGTTLSVKEVRAAYDAGAEYVVAPGTNLAVIAETKRLGMASIPGAMTPTEVCSAWDAGADIVKLFPADDMGLQYIQNLRGPLPHIPLMTTGGVNPVTIPQFLSAGASVVGTGATVLRKSLIETEDYESIYKLARTHREAVELWKKENAR